MTLKTMCPICGIRMRQYGMDMPYWCPDPSCERSHYKMVIMKE